LEHKNTLYISISYDSGQVSGEVYICFSGCTDGYVRQLGHYKCRSYYCTYGQGIKLH